MERTRCFLAFVLPAKLIGQLATVQQEVRGRWPEGAVRWVAVENLHLTLRFFGDLDRDEIDRVASVLKSRGSHWVPVPVRASRVSAFPSVSRPRVVWVGLSSSGDRLSQVAGEVDEQLQRAGFPPPDKPWKSHVTLGRVGRGMSARPPRGWERVSGLDSGSPDGAGTDQSGRGQSGRGQAGRGQAGRDGTEAGRGFELRSLVLMKSELKPSGAVYTPLYDVRA